MSTRYWWVAIKVPCNYGTSDHSLSPVSYVTSEPHPSCPRKCIHKFSANKINDRNQNGTTSVVTSLVQSPAIDVIGIGLSSGQVVIYDVRVDEKLLSVYMEGGGVRSISFRTGGLFQDLLVFADGHQMVNQCLLPRQRLVISHFGTLVPLGGYYISSAVLTMGQLLQSNGYLGNLSL